MPRSNQTEHFTIKKNPVGYWSLDGTLVSWDKKTRSFIGDMSDLGWKANKVRPDFIKVQSPSGATRTFKYFGAMRDFSMCTPDLELDEVVGIQYLEVNAHLSKDIAMTIELFYD